MTALLLATLALTPKPQVIVLGTYHMANPKLDLVKTELDDHLSAKRQAEIEDVVARLAKFRPTKILVEAMPEGKAQEQYRAYREGKYELTANEVDQIGMRLAKRMGLPDIHPVDWRNGMEFDPVFDFAKAHDPDLMRYIDTTMANAAKDMNGPREHTVRENLSTMNRPDKLRGALEPYLRMARLNDGQSYPGAELAAGWYARNLHIFGNLQKLAQPGDRILMIFGQSHVPLLRQFVESEGTMELVEPNKYLR